MISRLIYRIFKVYKVMNESKDSKFKGEMLIKLFMALNIQ